MFTPTSMTSSLSASRRWRREKRSEAACSRGGAAHARREGWRRGGGRGGGGEGRRDVVKLVVHFERSGRKGRKVETNARGCWVLLIFIMPEIYTRREKEQDENNKNHSCINKYCASIVHIISRLVPN